MTRQKAPKQYVVFKGCLQIQKNGSAPRSTVKVARRSNYSIYTRRSCCCCFLLMAGTFIRRTSAASEFKAMLRHTYMKIMIGLSISYLILLAQSGRRSLTLFIHSSCRDKKVDALQPARQLELAGEEDQTWKRDVKREREREASEFAFCARPGGHETQLGRLAANGKARAEREREERGRK